MARRSRLVTFDGVGELHRRKWRRSFAPCPASRPRRCFCRALHVAGTDRAKLERAIAAFTQLTWREVEPRLEDVFIHELTTEEGAQ